jgi:hypothetical protein
MNHQGGHTGPPLRKAMQPSAALSCSWPHCLAVAGARRAGGGLKIRHSGPRSGIHAFHSGFHDASARADTQVRPYNDNAVEIARSSVGAHLRVRPLSIHGHEPSGRTHRSAPTKGNAAFCLILFLAPLSRRGGSKAGRRGAKNPSFRTPIRNPCLHSGFHDASARADTQVRPYNDNAVEIARSSVGAHLRVRPLSIHGHEPSGRTHRSAPTKGNAAFCLILFLAPLSRRGGSKAGRRGAKNPSFRTPIRNPCLHSGFHDASARADTQVRPYNDNAVEIARSSVGAHLRVRPLSIHGHEPSGRTHRSAPTKGNAAFSSFILFLAPLSRRGGSKAGRRVAFVGSPVAPRSSTRAGRCRGPRTEGRDRPRAHCEALPRRFSPCPGS